MITSILMSESAVGRLVTRTRQAAPAASRISAASVTSACGSGVRARSAQDVSACAAPAAAKAAAAAAAAKSSRILKAPYFLTFGAAQLHASPAFFATAG